MANYVKSYRLKDELVWTWPGHKSNLLEGSYAQRKRSGETSLATKVYTVDIPPPVPPVKYNQWGEGYCSASESDSEDEPAAAARSTVAGNHPAARNGMDEYGDSEGYSSVEDIYDGSDMGSDDEDEDGFPEGEDSDADDGDDIQADGPAVAAVPAVSDRLPLLISIVMIDFPPPSQDGSYSCSRSSRWYLSDPLCC